MLNQFSRTEIILGSDAMKKLNSSRVAVFGIGGVGSYAAEALVRAGIGTLDLIDGDKVCLTNINRQLFATHLTLDIYKTDAAFKRLKEINPDIKINAFNYYYNSQNAEHFSFTDYDYIIDAIDMVSSKLLLAQNAYKSGVPIISSMGAGNKLDPTAFEVTDIYKTSVCPLAKVMRTELKKRKIKKLKVVYSKELPLKPEESEEKNENRRQIPGSVSFVPPVVGLIIAGEVIKDLTKIKGRGIGA